MSQCELPFLFQLLAANDHCSSAAGHATTAWGLLMWQSSVVRFRALDAQKGMDAASAIQEMIFVIYVEGAPHPTEERLQYEKARNDLQQTAPVRKSQVHASCLFKMHDFMDVAFKWRCY